MKNIVRIILEGTYSNIMRILFASDRVTDMELRNKILEGSIAPTDKVAKIPCIGCAGCKNVCPTSAIEMVKLEEPVELIEGLIKEEIPVLDSLKCVNCYYCHDFCPLYALFGEAGTIHPNDVGAVEENIKELLKKPVKISDDKIAFISQYLSDNAIIRKRENKGN
ncbi:MAG: 4Fe-4S dicluster domain-containing protein [Methanobacterium sp.]|jgi:energy-converting hydrogenase B subunit L